MYSPIGNVKDIVDNLFTDGWGLTWADGLLWASDPINDKVYRICLFPDTRHLFYRYDIVNDSSGNNNGRFDPGETVEITVKLTNSGGLVAENVQGTLMEDDTYITIFNSSSTFGSIETGESAINSGEPFIVYANAETPEGHIVKFDLVVSTVNYTDTLTFKSRVGLPCGDFLVWDPDPNHSSGPVIEHILDLLNYKGEYTVSLRDYFGSLHRFNSIWVCLGQYPQREVISKNSVEADSLEDYLLNKPGRMYLEGSEVFYYDPQLAYGYDFGPLFEINGLSDGQCDLETIIGQKLTFTRYMVFPYRGENSWIDRLGSYPGSQSFPIFKNSNPEYFCGIAYDGDVQKTVGVSFEFSGLMDSVGYEFTKRDLADSIMHFFGITAGVEEKPIFFQKRRISDYSIKPNPCQRYAEIVFTLSNDSYVRMRLFDITGRVIEMCEDGWVKSGIYRSYLDISSLYNGIYFLRLELGDEKHTQKLTVVR